MNKKRVAIIAIILFLGLGTFVFANPSEDNLEEKDINNISSATNEYDDNTSNNWKNSNSETDSETTDKKDNSAIIDDSQIINQPSNLATTITSDRIGNGNYSNGNNTINNSGNNNQPPSNNQGNSNQPTTPTTPTNPTNPSNPGEPVEPTNPEDKEDYSKIKDLVNNLQNQVLTATNKNLIVAAKEYRDNNKIPQEISNIKDAQLKKELQAILDELNKILNDNQKPIISGIKDGSYTKENVSLTITENNLKTIILNGNIVKVEDLKNISQEGLYQLSVIDSAYNEEKITFTIDKTAPVAEVKTSNNNGVTNKDVTVTITINEEIKEVKDWTLSKDNKTLTKVFDKDTKDSIIIEDLAGNTTKVTYKVENINKEMPTVIDIKYSTTELTNKDVVVTITTSKPILTPAGWEMAGDAHTFTKTYTENTEETVILKDIYTNQGSVVIKITNIDKNPPEFIVETSNNNQKTNKNVIVTIKANKMIKEVSGWTISSDKQTISKEFKENITDSIIIEDLAGNKKEVTYQVINIDKEITDVTVTTSNEDQPTNKNVTVTITATEELQEVKGWILSPDKKSLYRVFEKNTNGSVTIRDLAGNSKIITYRVVNIDKEIPKVTEDNIFYTIDENNDIIVTIKTSKPILTPAGWKMVGNAYVFTKKYTQDTIETIILRDLYTNQNTLTLKVNRAEIIKNQKNQQKKIQKIASSVAAKIFNLSNN